MPVIVLIKPPPDPLITIPNVFTPNDDGVNDLFRIKIEGQVQVNRLAIYSRWGQLVYETTGITNFWDGKLKGKPLPAAAYYYIFDGINKYTSQPIIRSGSITLLR